MGKCRKFLRITRSQTETVHICFLSKYPPIEGGVSKTAYWLARGLARRGHHVHVVTNADQVEPESRLHLDPEDGALLTADFSVEGGGRVTLSTPDPAHCKPRYIPKARPDVSQLAGLALDYIQRHPVDVVLSFYLEPYSVAGHVAASQSNLPHVIRHAGSDLFGLAARPGLQSTYRSILQSATRVITVEAALEILGQWGIHPPQAAAGIGTFCPSEYFHPDANPLDVDELLESLRWTGQRELEAARRWNTAPFPSNLPTLGIYGKVGTLRGSFDLIRALERLAARGLQFNVLAMAGGTELPEFRHHLEHAGLRPRSWCIPFLPHWRVPHFIRRCTAVACLERGFWLENHAPAVVREVMACGTCLILSGELTGQSISENPLTDRKHALIVRDPRDIDALTSTLETALTEKDRTREIGMHGYHFSRQYEGMEVALDCHETILTEAVQEGSPAKSTTSPARTVSDTIAKSSRFDLSDVVERYARDHRVNDELASRHGVELKRFLVMCAIAPESYYGMAGPIDDLWHTFIIFTRTYERFCQEVAGRYLHHQPLSAGKPKSGPDTYIQFLHDYEQVFQEVPPLDIWPRSRAFEIVGTY